MTNEASHVASQPSTLRSGGGAVREAQGPARADAAEDRPALRGRGADTRRARDRGVDVMNDALETLP